MNLHDILKKSPAPGFMFEIEGNEIALTGRPANERETILTKSLGDPTMDELVQIIKDTEAGTESELVKELEDSGVGEEGIQVAKAVARLADGFGEEVDINQIAKALGADVESEDDEPVDSEGTITKSDLRGLDEDTRERIEKRFDQQEERIETLMKRLDEKDRDSRRSEWLTKAEELEAVPVDAGDLADKLVKLEDSLGTDAAEDYLETLSGADEVAKSGNIFEEQGSSASGSSGGDAYAKVQKKAEELRKSDTDLSRAEAIDRVMQDNPDLAKKYREER